MSTRLLGIGLKAEEFPISRPGTNADVASKSHKLLDYRLLGYIGAASTNLTDKNLPDPKDRIHTIDRLRDAGTLLVQHRDEEAVAARLPGRSTW